jgi:hypothetical protein
MDGRHLDQLSKRLADPQARRSVLKGLGGLVAGLLARTGVEPAAAAPCPSQVRCGQGPTAVCCRNATDSCSNGNMCQSATLACPVGGDASTPRYRCTASRGFTCDCATEENTGNFVCVNVGDCADCTNPSTPCPDEQRCVEASSCTHGTACVTLCP